MRRGKGGRGGLSLTKPPALGCISFTAGDRGNAPRTLSERLNGEKVALAIPQAIFFE
jgi:hypothetical protein